MKTKFKYLTKQSLKKKMQTKWFKWVNIVLVILFIFLANIDKVISLFGGDYEGEVMVYVEDEVGSFDSFTSLFLENQKAMQPDRTYQFLATNENAEVMKEKLEENKEAIWVRLLFDETNYLKAEILSYNDVGTVTKGILTTSINSLKNMLAVTQSGLSEEEILALTMPPTITSMTTNPEVENEENKNFIATVASFIVMLPCFFLILLLVQMVGAEINDEKTTRSMEIIISNVSPQAHFLSKICASTLFVLLQGVLLLCYGGIALVSRLLFSGGFTIHEEVISGAKNILEMIQTTGILKTLGQGLPFFILLFVSSFILYAIVAGVLASMTTSIEDFQQLQTPMMLVIMVGYYLALMATEFEGAIFIKAMAYVPMISFLLAPVLFLLGQMTMFELFISSVISILFTWVVFHYGLRIYKVGILNYSSSKLWRKLFHSLKKN